MPLFARISRLIRGFFGLFVSGLEEQNPEALLEVARSDFRNKMAQYNEALARLAGIAERLKVQIKTKTTKIVELERRILANYKAGNNELAGSLARELQDVKVDLESDSAELKETEEGYQNNVRHVKVAQKEFEDKVRKIERQLNQVRVKEAQAEAAAALNGVAFKVGDVGDTLKSVEEVLEKRYEMAAGKARVVQDVGELEKVKEKEVERKALEQQALAEFLATQGVQMEQPSSQTSAAPKEIGPKETPQQN